ncbi:MarR family winged helix-turn-helix transcriptional regulator [Pusillimonas noertemannii]|uniref:MarR family transcriptional regulator n=1 Tax=Pusillimonas noertemannii TaxID=305977 RepID=A0A2U1CKB1_9BURK|nr:MarR family winged helix-turn-helix transcriptional regulator [Pusillimonas noertemannii]NYT69645.1 winged helix-turn-helix transcriptional regulator [Pusillimonas noertemannii]PVY61431.1 MarR family transcriptional regulator [Pusillimonas noertemannii]TFL08970.1 MarR family transcriptional regulator [Pusillimonas noertemannii]
MPNDDPSMPDASLDHNIASQMASIIFRLDQILRDTILRKLDLTYIHFRVLQYLYEKDGRQIGEIAAAIVVRQPVLSRVIDQMEERALVRRSADPQDSRRMRVYLTDHGRSRYQEAWPPAHELLETSLKGFKGREREALRRLLKKMAANLF